MQHLKIRARILCGRFLGRLPLHGYRYFLLFLFSNYTRVKWYVVPAKFGLNLIPHGVGLGKERFLGDHVPLEKVPLVPTLYGEATMLVVEEALEE
jgi:hypothetical protein